MPSAGSSASRSAKSLRGGEMADVIFNGSASRRSLGLAEVTHDLRQRASALAIDADEVQITRRVYRNGEGEYLINGQVCRLKDIKDLFLGTGAGTDAYCIIAAGPGRCPAAGLDARNAAPSSRKPPASAASTPRRSRRCASWSRSSRTCSACRDIQEELHRQLQSVRLQAAKAERTANTPRS